jgi:uncharacterized membrane protein YfcA
MPEAIIALVAFAAGAVRGLTGFGGPLILVPTMSFVYEPASAVATVMLVDLASNFALLRDATKEANWRVVGIITAGAAATLPIGGYLMLHADPRIVRMVVYGTVAALSILLLSGWRYSGTYSRGSLLGAGAVNGIIVGATSFGAALYPFLLGNGDSARTGRATFVLWALFCSVAALAVVFAGDRAGHAEFLRAAFLVPSYLLGTYAGKRFFHRVDDVALKRIVLLTLVTVSIAGLVAVW